MPIPEAEPPGLNTFQIFIAAWGAGLSTFLGAIKLWETFWKDRLRFDTTYIFNGLPDLPDEITVANLSAVPILVSHWSLAWKPRLFMWWKSRVDVTPDDPVRNFKIEARSTYTFHFAEMDKLPSGPATVTGRDLYLTLHIFGRRKPEVLKIGGGK